jgi:CIC family chloride channel protein
MLRPSARGGAVPARPEYPIRRLRALGRRGREIALGAVAGVLAGVAAAGLHAALGAATPRLVGRFADLGGPEVGRFELAILLFPALGGLLSGVVVQLVSRLRPAHGTDQVVRAFHRDDGVLPFRGPATRAAASVGVIAFGGSAGPEGPIAGLGAAIGSWLGRALRLTPRERRVLLIAGCAAGVGAIFRCPLGGALFATSILYRRPEFESTALVPSFVASAVGYASFAAFQGFGAHLLSEADRLQFAGALEVPLYVGLGLLCGASAILFSQSLHRTEAAFARLRAVPPWLRPALGGLLTGALACALPQVMDGDYRVVQNALDGSLFVGPVGGARSLFVWTGLLGLLVVAKCAATGFTLGSGAAGGLIGPGLAVGGLVGAFLGVGLEAVAPGLLDEPLRRALVPVGMAGVLAAAMRTPIAAIVMVLEITGSYGLVVPLMLTTVVAYLTGGRFGLIDEQVQSAADSPGHAGELLVGLLERNLVRDAMQGVWPAVVPRSAPLARVVASLPPDEAATAFVVERGHVVGVIAFAELRHAIDAAALGPIAIAEDLMSGPGESAAPDDTLYDALGALARSRADVLPVTDPRDGAFLGVLTRAAVHGVVVRHLTAVREDLLHEHAGFAAIEEEAQLVHLLSAMPGAQAGRVERISVDPELVGRSLREADFRRRHGGFVLAVQTADRHLLCPPDPARPLRADDLLLVLTRDKSAADSEPSPLTLD